MGYRERSRGGASKGLGRVHHFGHSLCRTELRKGFERVCEGLRIRNCYRIGNRRGNQEWLPTRLARRKISYALVSPHAGCHHATSIKTASPPPARRQPSTIEELRNENYRLKNQLFIT